MSFLIGRIFPLFFFSFREACRGYRRISVFFLCFVFSASLLKKRDLTADLEKRSCLKTFHSLHVTDNVRSVSEVITNRNPIATSNSGKHTIKSQQLLIASPHPKLLSRIKTQIDLKKRQPLNRCSNDFK